VDWKNGKALGSEESSVMRFNVEMNRKMLIEVKFLPHCEPTLTQI
jgi:hypothetical protein